VFGQAEKQYIKPVIYYYLEVEPQTDGDFWHYVDGVPTIWQ
jgi:hypothetical protein